MLFQLVQAGQLIAVRSGDGERETAFTPAHDIASMTVYGVGSGRTVGKTTFDLGQTPELARADGELEMLKDLGPPVAGERAADRTAIKLKMRPGKFPHTSPAQFSADACGRNLHLTGFILG